MNAVCRALLTEGAFSWFVGAVFVVGLVTGWIAGRQWGRTS